MKIKLILIILILGGFQKNLFSQIAIKAGYNICDTKVPRSYSDKLNQEHSNGIVFGISFDQKIYKSLHFQPEITYIEQGFETITRLEYGTTVLALTETKYSYAQFQLLPSLLLFENRFFSSNILLGMYFGYLVNNRFINHEISNPFPTRINGKSTLELNPFDYGTIYGLQFSINAGKGKIVLEGKFANGLNDFDKMKSDNFYIKNIGFYGTIGYKFQLWKPNQLHQ